MRERSQWGKKNMQDILGSIVCKMFWKKWARVHGLILDTREGTICVRDLRKKARLQVGLGTKWGRLHLIASIFFFFFSERENKVICIRNDGRRGLKIWHCHWEEWRMEPIRKLQDCWALWEVCLKLAVSRLVVCGHCHVGGKQTFCWPGP